MQQNIMFMMSVNSIHVSVELMIQFMQLAVIVKLISKLDSWSGYASQHYPDLYQKHHPPSH